MSSLRRNSVAATATTALTVLCALLGAACSKETPTPSTLPGESELSARPTTPQRAVEPEEECVHQCMKQQGGAGAKLTALDDCMMDSCYGDPPMEDPTTAQCEAVGAGKITYTVAARDRCVARSCCAQARACAADPQCSGQLACVVRCHAR